MSSHLTHAVVLAGGKGTRLRPYTVALPKPLVPIGSKPILEHIIIGLRKQGIEHVVLAVNHMSDLLKAYFGSGEKYGINISYSLETKELSTMGPLTQIEGLPERFLVMNGDVLTDLALDTLTDSHLRSGAAFTIAAHQQNDRSEYGVLHTNEDGRLTKFEEKPEMSFLVSMGMYIMERSCLHYIPKDSFFGFDHLMYAMIEAGDLPSIHIHDGYWLDIGRPSDYERAIESADELGLT